VGEVKLERLVFFLIVSCLFLNLAIYFQNQSIDVLRSAVRSLERDRSERWAEKWQPEIERNRRRFELLDKLVDEDDDFVKSTVKGAHSG
jgi:hypothetical protein